jgi:hypothetical protein
VYSFPVRLGRALRALWLQVGVCIAFLIVLDVFLRLGFWAREHNSKDYDSRVLADGYKNAAWAEEVLADNSRTLGAMFGNNGQGPC